MNGTHQLLVYANDINLLGDSINTTKENTETLLEAGKDVGLEINVEMTMYMIMSHLRTQDRTRIYGQLMNHLKMWQIQMLGDDTNKSE
jgi:hypothetical protein